MADDVLVVTIFDQEYNIKLGDNDPEYIKLLAKKVHDKITKFRLDFPDMDFKRLMVLVCLNIADEQAKASESKLDDSRNDLNNILFDIRSLLEHSDTKTDK